MGGREAKQRLLQGLPSERMRAGPGCGVASEVETREAGRCEWAAASPKNISHIRPDSANRNSSASRLREPQRHLRSKGSSIGEAFNPHAFSQQTGEDYWWVPIVQFPGHGYPSKYLL